MTQPAGLQNAWKSLWPIMLTEACRTCSEAVAAEETEGQGRVLAAILLARNAIDSFVNELAFQRDLPKYVCRSHHADRRQQFMLQPSQLRASDADLAPSERGDFISLCDVPLVPRLRLTVLLLKDSDYDPFSDNFFLQFRETELLSALRNLIVHHTIGDKSQRNALIDICKRSGVPELTAHQRWEDALIKPPVASWACAAASKTILALSAMPYRRRTPFETTQGIVATAFGLIHDKRRR